MDLFNQYYGKQDLQLQLKWLELFRKTINRDDFKAAALLGSFAKGCPDRLSDLDILVWVEKEKLRNAASILFSLSPYKIIHAWKKEFASDHIFGKFIYDNFVSVEIHILSIDSSFKLKNPYIILKDMDSILNLKTEAGDPPKQEDFLALEGGVDGLGWELFEMLKWWHRGKKSMVRNHLKKITTKLDELK